MSDLAAVPASGAPPGTLDDRSLERVRRLIHATAGISLGERKASMVQARLAKRLAATGCSDIAAYLDHVERPEGEGERAMLVSAMTTNVTHFFREQHHFEHLRETFATRPVPPRPLRFWSAACSSGQEPYSMAMVLDELGYGPAAARILATDIDRQILARAAAASYGERELGGIPPNYRRGIVAVGGGAGRMAPQLRALISFRYLNLVGSWPLGTSFDAIFCRNVAIYFDADTQERLWRRLIDALRPGGFLYIGHSERLPDAMLGRVRYLGKTTYLRHPTESDGAT